MPISLSNCLFVSSIMITSNWVTRIEQSCFACRPKREQAACILAENGLRRVDTAWPWRSVEEQSDIRLRSACARQGSILARLSHDRAVRETRHPRAGCHREENQPEDTGAVLEVRRRAKVHEIESPGCPVQGQRLHRQHGRRTAETCEDEQL